METPWRKHAKAHNANQALLRNGQFASSIGAGLGGFPAQIVANVVHEELQFPAVRTAYIS